MGYVDFPAPLHPTVLLCRQPRFLFLFFFFFFSFFSFFFRSLFLSSYFLWEARGFGVILSLVITLVTVTELGSWRSKAASTPHLCCLF